MIQCRLLAAIGLLSLITLLPTTASSQPKVTMPEWLQFVKTCSEKYGVDPHFALAVAEVESSDRKGQRFRFGRMGRGTYYGPFGIHKCFLRKWDIGDPFTNTLVGIRALSRYKDQRRSLRRYNTAFNEGYWRAIKKIEKRNRREQIFNQARKP